MQVTPQRNKRVGQRNGRVQTGGKTAPSAKKANQTENEVGSTNETTGVRYEKVNRESAQPQNVEDRVPGLIYVDDFITEEEEQELISIIDEMEWNGKLERRTQHYGYDWDAKTNMIDPTTQKPLPDFIAPIVQRLLERQLVPYVLDQMIINEYLPGQGINTHVDRPCFDDYIVSISLGSQAVMKFDCLAESERSEPVLLKPRSAVILSGESRYKWRHSIDRVKFDDYKGQRLVRGRRVSITLRRALRS